MKEKEETKESAFVMKKPKKVLLFEFKSKF